MKKVLFILLSISFAFALKAQSYVDVTGTVRDAVTDEELIGVTILVTGTEIGTVTDLNGAFTLSVPVNSTLRISYVGYSSQEISVTGTVTLDIRLQPETQLMDELVVVGYTVQKKSTLTGAVAPVSMGDMERRRVPDVRQALQGQVAGVQVTQSTGAPGDEIDIRIRGEGTIGNNNPLYIIDGVPTRELSFINPADIESMTVLKDASAAAIYGSRASAGVIVITTKSGVKGKTKLDINYYAGVQQVSNLPM
ncbi:MAG: TonB-dependent receptor plug domain-containing protein, partial [Proteiniphilum sp.]